MRGQQFFSTGISTMRRLCLASLVLGISLCASTAFAEAGFEYRLEKKVQVSEGMPALVLRATGQIKSGTVTFKSSTAKSFTKKIGAMKSGETKTITMKQSPGTHKFEIKIKATGADGEVLDDAFEVETTSVAPLKLSVDPKKANLGEGKIQVGTNRPLDHIKIEIFDSKNQLLHEGTRQLGGQKGEFEVNWPTHADVTGVRLTAHDVDGFWQSVLLEPFWVEIPHKEIIFEFGKASWTAEEEPKLEATLATIRDAMEKYKDKGLQMQLYIAGYTDTVGSKSDNLRLSTARAKAIATWFRKKGLKIPLYYQGFGESVLAVKTEDETKEERNRRVIYVLGNSRPPTSETLPKSNWKAVR
ncbi:OmpA family protein [Bradymonas sediminis]|nr:OmpA family protein [Bradymonas sediminis]TDP75195.1 OmpA family protein [Bradymonas sediminis]